MFLSYVKEDKEAVDALCGVLEAAQIPYWRDRKSLGPGDAWKAKIRDAVRDGSLVFLACFSDNSRSRDKSYQNEELTLAIEEYRKMPPGRTWLIPVRFDDGPVPEWDLGAGRVLGDLNYSDLFGDDHMKNMAELLTTIHRLTGEKRPDAATAMAAVEQATSANRPDLLRRLTKEMLLEPSRRIELDDLISKEVQRVNAALTDQERVQNLAGTGEEQLVKVAQEAKDLWELSEPFCSSLQVAARYGTTDDLAPWAGGVRAFVSSATRTAGGSSALLGLRHLPAVAAITTATIASVSSGKWGNLKSLIVDPVVRDKHERKPTALLEVTDPYEPFSNGSWADCVLARSTIESVSLADAVSYYSDGRQGKYYTPLAEWMHCVLRPLFRGQWPEDDAFATEYDRAEVVLGVLAQDAVNVRIAASTDGKGFGRSRWFGRSTWRAGHYEGDALEDLVYDFNTKGASWEPLRAGLFGEDEGRARDAIEKYGEHFNRAVSSRSF